MARETFYRVVLRRFLIFSDPKRRRLGRRMANKSTLSAAMAVATAALGHKGERK